MLGPQALVQEIKLLPDVWPKMSKSKQDDVIYRLRERVESKVKMAVHLISAEGRTVVAGDLDQITIKDGVKAVIKFSASAPALRNLLDDLSECAFTVSEDISTTYFTHSGETKQSVGT